MEENKRFCNKVLALVILFIVFTCVVPQRNNQGTQNNPQNYEKQMLDRLINNNQQYDTSVRPTVKNTSEPTEITVHVSVRSLEFMDILKNEYTTTLLLSQEWEDSRLSYTQHNPPKRLRYLTILDTSKIWKPDLTFFNEKSITSNSKGRSFAKLSPAGKVTLVLRVTATLSCPVNIRLFPFDSQKCPLKLTSAAFSREDVTLKWKNPAIHIEVNPDFALMPGMVYHSITNEISDIQTESGVYSCLTGSFIFNRLKGHYWKQLYIPCTALVVLGWFSFLLDGTGIPGIARAVLVGVTWAVAYFRISEFHHVMPKVAYSTAFDVWTGMCLAFIFVSVLLTFTSIYMANHGHTKVIPLERLQAIEARKRLGEISALYAQQQQHRPACLSSSFVVDRIFVFAYPILFTAFAVAYFTVCLKVARAGLEELRI